MRIIAAGALLFCAVPPHLLGQPVRTAPEPALRVVEQPDAQRTRQELAELLQRYPPSLRNVLALDHSLLENQAYLSTYPALASYLNTHPEIARNPSFYVGEGPQHRPADANARMAEMWGEVLTGVAVFTGFGMAIGLLTWLIRTFVDYRRWSRLAKVQTDVHTKLVDRFTANEDLLNYIQSPAGSRFLQSAPIMLDGAPRSVGAPLSRILWSLQGGVVLLAAGAGLQVVSARATSEAAQPLAGLGILAIALGAGFIASAVLSFFLSRRLGLIEPVRHESRQEMSGA